jgi:CheY-like chemotaxis protein
MFTFPITNIERRRASKFGPNTIKAIPSAQRDKSLPKKNLLLAEDNAILRKVYQRTLADDFVCTVAKAGHEAVVMYEAQINSGSPFDLLVLDYNMPVRKGIDVARLIRKNAPHLCTPIVFLTGDIGEQVRASIDNLNNVHLLLKPSSKIDMVDLFHTLLNEEAVDQSTKI